MYRNALVLMAAAGLMGCSNTGEGIWYVNLPVIANTECVTTYDENFAEAQAPEEADPDSEWVVEDTTTLSDAAFFMQIIAGKKGEGYLVLGDEVYPGTIDKGVMHFEWPSFIDSSYDETYVAEGYQWSEVNKTSTLTTIDLTLDKETKDMRGTWASKTETALDYTETDEWDGVPGVYTGQINNAVLTWLVGNGTNEADAADCDTEPCFLNVTASCDGATEFTAKYTTLAEEGAFEALEDAEQDAGL